MTRPVVQRQIALVAALLITAACTTGSLPSVSGSPVARATPVPASPPATERETLPPASASPAAPPAAASPTVPATPAARARVIPVTLSDALRIDPATMTLASGEALTFVVTNSGALTHEFFLGDAAAQDTHEAEVVAGIAPTDTDHSLVVAPGQTEQLTFTFAVPGESLAGCHITNHYAGGMKATITVTE